MRALRDLWGFIKKRKKFWLVPLLLALLVVAVFIYASSAPAVAPFLYTIF